MDEINKPESDFIPNQFSGLLKQITDDCHASQESPDAILKNRSSGVAPGDDTTDTLQESLSIWKSQTHAKQGY